MEGPGTPGAPRDRRASGSRYHRLDDQTQGTGAVRKSQSDSESLPDYYRRYLLALGATITGNWAQNVALAVIAYTVSQSGVVVGVVVSSRQVPLLVLGPLVGRYLDRWRRARAIALTEYGGGIISALFALLLALDLVDTGGVIALGASLGILSSIGVPARQALIGDLVTPDLVSKATSSANLASAIGRIVGPAIAAVLLSTTVEEWVFLVNSLSYVVAGLLFSTLGHDAAGARVPKGAEGAASVSPLEILRLPGLGPALGLVLTVSVLVMNAHVVLLVLTEDLFLAPGAYYGLLVAALGLGGVIGTVAAGRIRRPTVRQLSSAALVSGVVLFATGVVGVFIVLIALALVGGFLAGAFATMSATYCQLKSPTARRGQVMALYAAVFTGASPLGAPLAGFLVDAVGAKVALLVLGATTMGIALAHLVSLLVLSELLEAVEVPD